MNRLCVTLIGMAAASIAGCGREDSGDKTSGEAAEGAGVFIPDQIEVALSNAHETPSVRLDARFVNQGTGPLEIVEIKTSCACTMAGELSESRLPPGEGMLIPIDVIPPPYDTKSATVTVVTSPPSASAKLLILAKGRTREPPFVEEIPRIVNLSHASGTPLRGVARLTCVETSVDRPWLTSARIANTAENHLHVELIPSPDPTPYIPAGTFRRAYEVIVTTAEAEQHLSMFDVQLQTRDTALPVNPETIRFRVDTVELIQSIPEIIRWDLSADDTARSRQALLVFGVEDEWSVRCKSQLPEWLAVEIHRPETASFRQLRMQLDLIDTSRLPPRFELVVSATAPRRDPVECRIPLSFTGQ